MNDSTELYLGPRQLQALGSFAAHWSFFETEMDFTISALAALARKDPGMPHRFNERIKYWRKLVLARYKTPDIFREATSIIADAKELYQGRCVVLHGRVYGRPPKHSRRIIIQTHRHIPEWRIASREINTASLFEGAELVRRLARRLIAFNQKYLPVEPPSLPRRYP